MKTPISPAPADIEEKLPDLVRKIRGFLQNPPQRCAPEGEG